MPLEGPFDDDFGFGSLEDAWNATLSAFIEEDVEKLPHHTLLFLSTHAAEIREDWDDEETFGFVWAEAVIAAVRKVFDERASNRTLHLIGADRAEMIPYEVDGRGLVWSALSERSEADHILNEHLDAVTASEADLSDFARAVAEAYLTSARSHAFGTIMDELLMEREDEISAMLIETDILPALEEMRTELLMKMDG